MSVKDLCVIAGIVVAVLAAVSAFFSKPEKLADIKNNNIAEYCVRSVVDGDTVELANGRRLRYIGVDAPETRYRQGNRWVYAPEQYAEEAKKFNREMVEEKNVRLEFDTVKEDKYGRWLAYVYVGDVMVNEALLREGVAVVFTFPPNVRYTERFIAAQQDARVNKRGLWGTLQEISAYEAWQHEGKFRQVRGFVDKIQVSRDRMVLVLRSAEDRPFTCVIYAKNLEFFTKKKIDPFKVYDKKDIEVVGKVRKGRNGVSMILDDPSQVRICS
ncbi:MAG TPA: thermonuclease family protein [Candidatus Omnitrophota bacterium]|nr:thermonuclease family protein [Candidatus Omnitrophota bacterium]